MSVATGGAEANDDAESSSNNRVSLSADGRYVLFASLATNLVASDTNGRQDCFLRDRQAGTTVRVSVGPGGTQNAFNCRRPGMSPDARWIVYGSTSGGACRRYDSSNGAVIDVPYFPLPPPDNFICTRPLVSDDGNLVASDQGTVVVADVLAGTATRVDVNAQGASNGTGGILYGFSGNGRFVLLNSDAENLDQPSEGFTASQMYLKDRTSGSSFRVSQRGSTPASIQALQGALTPDGAVSAFYATSETWGIAGETRPHAFVETEATNAIFGLYPSQGGFE